ncbi:MAG: hypothetical protein QNK19_03845 [Xanthomonadales bacterium]|nr:hypothetical protein [Xanthomonadales bacterium]
MNSKVTLTQDGNTATLHISSLGEELKIEPGRLRDIAQILETWLEVEAAFEDLPEEIQTKRLRGYMAQDMKVQFALAALVSQSTLLREITNGNASIGDYGFPEFQDE